MLLDAFKAIFNQLYVWLMQFLPNSPFQAIINALGSIPYLSYFNWFFPVTEVLAVMEAWLMAVAIYYLYQAIMRYIHLIG